MTFQLAPVYSQKGANDCAQLSLAWRAASARQANRSRRLVEFRDISRRDDTRFVRTSEAGRARWTATTSRLRAWSTGRAARELKRTSQTTRRSPCGLHENRTRLQPRQRTTQRAMQHAT